MNQIPNGYLLQPNGEYARLSKTHHQGLRAIDAKPVERVPLDIADTREEACWPYAHVRFEVTFTVYSMRPADYDGYDIKYLQDFLVSSGIITRDDWKTLSGRTVSRKAATKEEERTEITILALP